MVGAEDLRLADVVFAEVAWKLWLPVFAIVGERVLLVPVIGLERQKHGLGRPPARQKLLPGMPGPSQLEGPKVLELLALPQLALVLVELVEVSRVSAALVAWLR
jgi:hypothetical protein